MTDQIEKTSLRDVLCASVTEAMIGQRVTVCGWVAKRREHGEHLAFVDLRDYTGIVQCVVPGSVDVRGEYVLRVTGLVSKRPDGTINDRLTTGQVEMTDCTVEVLSIAEPPPFQLDGRVDTDEMVRLRFRFLDLRREAMQRNLRLRAKVNQALRKAMDEQKFCEVETPLLWAPTPEGAREFVVPSRLHPGEFYVLPQSPQIAKQLLMVGGFDRYYQIARCLRDEDLRADRQFEFTQLDIEASFVTQEDILGFVSKAVLDAAEVATGVRPETIDSMTWAEALDLYGTDKPDLRYGMVIQNLSALFENTEVKAFSAPVVKAIRVPEGAAFSRSKLDALTEQAKSLGAKGLAWFKITAEGVDSPLARFLTEAELAGIAAVDGAQVGDLVLCVADEHALACRTLGALRVTIADMPVSQGPYRYLWVTEFPMFEGVDEDGNLQAAHHPFTMPHADDIALMATDPLKVRSQAYDLVLNGWELGSGSVRIHRSDIQAQVFSALGISDEEAESRFGFLMGAFKYGAPPHAGFAFGIDRLVAIFAGEDNIREVIAYPKTQSGADVMTGAPKNITERQVRDLRLKFAPKV
jgi:aspartyl-tRNA synthetase